MTNTFQKAIDAVACDILKEVAQAATWMGVWTMWSPVKALVPLTIGGISYWMNQALCDPTDFNNDKPDDQIDGCRFGPEGMTFPLQYKSAVMVEWGQAATRYNGIDSIGPLVNWGGGWGYELNMRTIEGTVQAFRHPVNPDKEIAATTVYRMNVPPELCQQESHPQDEPSDPDLSPREWTDPETNCTYNIKLEGFAEYSDGGLAYPVFTVGSAAGARADGGRVGGCYLEQHIVVWNGPGGGGGGGGNPLPPPVPVPPDGGGGDGGGGDGGGDGGGGGGGPDIPWWVVLLAGAGGGSLITQILNQLGGDFQEGDFTLVAPCDKDEEGNALTANWHFLPGTFAERMNAHQVALMEIMQQHLSWKTPTCSSHEKPTLDGDWISTRWVSDSPSAGSRQYLRKLFRYRSKSTRTNDELQAYWSDFTWQAGPVCVIHKGSWWGTPQVWAASESEGQRVIRFAAGEAGIDPDQTGEWLTRNASSARYGMSGRMRLQEEQGEQWVTRREGASGLPEL